MARLSDFDAAAMRHRLHELFYYDAGAGQLRNKFTRSPKAVIGEVAGSVNPNGYRYISVDGKSFRAHRLIWLFVHGAHPGGYIDHINCIRDDNRIENLREVTSSENIANSPPRNACGLKGVQRSPEGWRSFIMKDGKYRALGTFSTAQAAHMAYCEEAYALYGDRAHSSVLAAIRNRKEA